VGGYDGHTNEDKSERDNLYLKNDKIDTDTITTIVQLYRHIKNIQSNYTGRRK
jgi:hypothetical protein